MIALSNFRTNIANYNVRNFGFTGGFDQGAINLANAPIVGNADSKGVKVAFFLKLQPFQWNQANAIQLKDQVAQISLDNQNGLGMLTFKRKRGYYVQTPIPAPTQADFTGDNAAKFVPYNAIINACTGVNPLVNLLPVYGINSDETGMCKTNGNIRPQNVLFDLIAAIRYTQGSVLPNLQRGAIMIVIADVSESCYNNIPPLPNGALSLNILLNGIGNNANAAIPNINQFVTNIQIVEGDLAANHVEIVSYDNPTLNDKILLLQGGAGADKILVVKMPGLPAAAFEYMYACSSLPCLLEGKNTANLVLNLNRPYLNLNSGNYPTLPLTQNGSPETLRCNSTVNSFLDSTATINNNLGNAFVLNPPSAGFQETPMYKIAQLTEESYTPAVPNQPYVPGNSLQPYFANLQTFFQNQQQDKLFLGLLFFLSYVNNIEAQ